MLTVTFVFVTQIRLYGFLLYIESKNCSYFLKTKSFVGVRRVLANKVRLLLTSSSVIGSGGKHIVQMFFFMRRIVAKLSLFGCDGLIMVGCGWLCVVTTKICPFVGAGCEFMPGRGWSHNLVILQAFLFPHRAKQ